MLLLSSVFVQKKEVNLLKNKAEKPTLKAYMLKEAKMLHFCLLLFYVATK